MAVTLDLRKYSVTRSDTPAEDLPPLVLPRAKVRLTLWLPVGSEAGEYEVRVVGSDGRALASAHGAAAVRSYVVRLDTEVELRRLSPGEYRLETRLGQDEWHRFVVLLR